MIIIGTISIIRAIKEKNPKYFWLFLEFLVFGAVETIGWIGFTIWLTGFFGGL